MPPSRGPGPSFTALIGFGDPASTEPLLRHTIQKHMKWALRCTSALTGLCNVIVVGRALLSHAAGAQGATIGRMAFLALGPLLYTLLWTIGNIGRVCGPDAASSKGKEAMMTKGRLPCCRSITRTEAAVMLSALGTCD